MCPSERAGTAAHPGAGARGRTPNRALRALLAETEWTQAAFARALARIGAEVGIHLRYDRTSVAHWLRGSRPDPRVQHLMAEAFSRRLGRPVTVAELGMRCGPGPGRGGGPGRGTRPGAGARPRGGRDDDETSDPAGRPPRAVVPGGGPGTRTAGQARAEHAWGPWEPDGGDGMGGTGVRPHPVDVRVLGFGRPAHPVDQLTALTAPVVPPPRADSPPPAPYSLGLLTAALRSAGPARPAGPEPAGHPAGTLPPGGAADSARAEGTAPVPAPGGPVPAPLPGARNTCTARGSRRTGRPGGGQVASVHEQARFFALQADRHGGGVIRTPLAACLSGLVRSLRSGEEGPHQRGLLAGAARLSFLLARVYADEQRHGLAQRAFLTAAELAEAARDPEGVALARRALSSQAHQLGHARLSLALAEAALAAAPADAEPSTRAFLYAGMAVAGAASGERRRALEAMGRAERQLARAPADLTTGLESPSGEPVGSYQDAALRYQAARMRAALGDADGAVAELSASLRARPAAEYRSRALCRAELAELLLARGRLEEACAAWEGFLDECAQVSSGRVRAARERIPGLLRPYARDTRVRSLLAQLSPSTAPADDC
ncbi:tol-pal system YbgF family protein [Streptomyces albus]|uniref:tetratricopeptide repeat protein n=1 Tax=Streptomyces TaxID=1883 RepID=UPI0004BD6330|nr:MULTISPECIES: hypothetical protein [unclassified Streptomyces]KPC92274.1 hypothetical protein ADL27_25800 [Streptomyces sp. NRRL F-6602]